MMQALGVGFARRERARSAISDVPLAMQHAERSGRYGKRRKGMAGGCGIATAGSINPHAVRADRILLQQCPAGNSVAAAVGVKE
jgi:hypothetical protein